MSMVSLLVLIVALVFSLRQIKRDRTDLARAVFVQQELLSLGEDLLDAESAQRGYLLTLDALYLRHFRSGDNNARARLPRLRALLDDPYFIRSLARVTVLVDAKLLELRETVALASQGNRKAAMEIVVGGTGKEYMDEFRDLRSALITAQRHELDLQQARSNVDMLLTLLLLTIGGTCTITVMSFHTRRTLRKLGEPVHALIEAMAAMNGGSVATHLAIANTDEIGEVANAFNTMNDRLAHSQEARDAATSALVVSHRHTQDSEQRLQTVTDNVPALISQVDRELRFQFVNRAFADWFGADTVASIGSSMREFDGGTLYTPSESFILRALSGETVTHEGEIFINGRRRHCHIVLVPQRNSTGELIGLFTFHTDITERRNAEIALRKSQSFLSRSGSAAGVGGWEIDLMDRRVTWSEQTRRLHDVDVDYVPTIEDGIRFYTEEARPVLTQALDECMEHGRPWDLDLEIESATGRRFWARATGVAEFEHGRVVRLVGSFQDITERRRLEKTLSDNSELMRVTLESIGDAVITTDRQGRVVWLNPVAESMTGWSREEALKQKLATVFGTFRTETRETGIDLVAVCLEQGKAVGLQHQTTLVSRDGAEYGIEDSAAPIRGADGQILGAVLVFHDVTEQRRLSQAMHHRAAHDDLTGLVNRAEFEARLSRLLLGATQEQHSHALMYIDLDEFKVVNDACGHSAGDLLLQQVSILLQGHTRTRDTVARLGGDEFGIILEHCNIAHAQLIAQNICEQLDAYRFVHDEQRYRIGTSIGLVPIDSNWPTSSSLIQAADSCCYAAKEEGRNRAHTWIESDLTLLARRAEMQWAQRLEVAIDENKFELYAQHIAPLNANDATGLHCEVLLRLREQGDGVKLASSFFPAAERFHLASRIDRWVINHVFTLLHSAETRVEDIGTIAINLSGQTIGDRDFQRTLVQLLRDARFDVSILCFEITETVAITRLGDAKLFIEELRSLGVRIALDDFGAGASSFSYLRILPVDFLKIDGQFIAGLLTDPLNNVAIRCFCDVAKVLGVTTIAEFVETSEVSSALRELGVDMAQGYLIHRPEPLLHMLPLNQRNGRDGKGERKAIGMRR